MNERRIAVKEKPGRDHKVFIWEYEWRNKKVLVRRETHYKTIDYNTIAHESTKVLGFGERTEGQEGLECYTYTPMQKRYHRKFRAYLRGKQRGREKMVFEQ